MFVFTSTQPHAFLLPHVGSYSAKITHQAHRPFLEGPQVQKYLFLSWSSYVRDRQTASWLNSGWALACGRPLDAVEGTAPGFWLSESWAVKPLAREPIYHLWSSSPLGPRKACLVFWPSPHLPATMVTCVLSLLRERACAPIFLRAV